MKDHFDICVVGAGPAGTTIANRLADLGYRIVIIEKSAFPRSQIGLSLTPGIRHWLKILDIEQQVEDLHNKRATKSFVLWSSTSPIIKEFEKEKAGFHVDRGTFDTLLLNECRKKKVKIYQPAIIKELKKNDTSTWNIHILKDKINYNITSTFIVDACGRKSIFKEKKITYQPKLLATYAYWNSKNTAYSFIEAGSNYWFWGAPLNNGKFVLCIFSDPSTLQESNNIETKYEKLLSESKYAYTIIKDNIYENFAVCDATPNYSNNVIGNSFIKIGDAAYTMDPISSQGVQKAIKSGIQGAIVVNTILKENNKKIAIQYYKDLIKIEVKKNNYWTSNFYKEQILFSDSSFWKKRKTNMKSGNQLDETISVKKSDVLELNKEGKFSMVPIVEKNEIIEIEGFLIKGNDEPYVFTESIYIIPLLKLIHKKTIDQSLRIVSDFIPKNIQVQFFKWLLYQKIVVPV
ncbi:NAD(P)/FAD-dependent oxidoreductase [Tenacibaculum sp.]|nr:NAD(P)/FAD-dependent oxidoreductase [Tenacibaculum sp.]